MAKKIFALFASSMLLLACSDNASDARIFSSTDFQNNDVVAKMEASFVVNEGCVHNVLELDEVDSYKLAKSAANSQIVEDVYDLADMKTVVLWVNEDGSATAELEFGTSCVYNTVDIWKELDTLNVSALIRNTGIEIDSVTGDTTHWVAEGSATCSCLTNITVNFPAEYLGARYIKCENGIDLIEYRKR